MSRAVVIITLYALLAGTLPAQARRAVDDKHAASAPDAVAVLGVEIDGDAPPEVRPQLERSLASGLGASGAIVRRRAEIEAALEKAPEMRGCATTACLARLAELVGARRFARARVEVHGAAYEIEVMLLGPDAEDGVLARSTRSCPVCTLTEANDLVAAAAAEVIAPTTVTLRVETLPPGCPVELDGTPLGIAPVETTHALGEVRLTASCPGRPPIEELVTLRPSAGPRVIQLRVAQAAPVDAPAPPRGRFGAWRWAAAGGAAGLLGLGITHLVLDGSGTSCADGEPCRELYETTTSGVLLVGAGLGLGALATWMFLTDGNTAASVQVDRTGATAGVRVTF